MSGAVRVRGVGKRYALGELEQYRALRDSISAAATRLVRREGRGRAARQHIWALQDVSFDIDAGEIVGLIGRNGAGKTTMLRLLSRITAPTTGEVAVRGRVGSLLEVGTGFHPELTGRENIFLNGAILGMRRTEIVRKLDEIIEFAEIAQFVSTPVKHYSVGMYMRLAFSVAAHLDAEILLIDEVLAVGDGRFQQKCLGKIGDVARSGRTVLFVSHNLAMTSSLCDRCLLFERGRLLEVGPPRPVIDRYLGLASVRSRPHERVDLSALERTGSGGARLVSATFRPTASREDQSIHTGDSIVVEVEIDADHDREVASFGLTITDESGYVLANVDSAAVRRSVVLTQGRNRLRVVLDRLPLAGGRYAVGLRLADPVTGRLGSGAIDMVDRAFHVEITGGSAATSTGAVSVGFSFD